MSYHYVAVLTFLTVCLVVSLNGICTSEQYEFAMAGWFSYGGHRPGIATVVGRGGVDHKKKVEAYQAQVLEFVTGKTKVEKYPMVYIQDYSKGKVYQARMDKKECKVHPLPGEMFRLCDDGDNVRKVDDMMVGKLMASVYTIHANESFAKITAYTDKVITPITSFSETWFHRTAALKSIQFGNFTDLKHSDRLFKVPSFCKDD